MKILGWNTEKVGCMADFSLLLRETWPAEVCREERKGRDGQFGASSI